MMKLNEMKDLSEIKDYSEWVAQTKMDGEYMFALKKGDNIQLVRYDKQNKAVNIAFKFPELKKAIAELSGDYLLKGEVFSYVKKNKDGVPERCDTSQFNGVQQRANLKDLKEIEKRMETYPLMFCVFDCLYKDGVDLKNSPYKERLEHINSMDLKGILTTPECAYGEEIPAFIERMKERDEEGVVLKKLSGTYETNKRSKTQFKHKFRLCTDVVFTGYETCKDYGIVCYNEEGIRVRCASRVQEIKDLIDTKGSVTLEIEYDSLTEDNKLRMPSFKSKIVG